MVRRRTKTAVIATRIGNHSFRATGIITYLKNGGTLKNAAAMFVAPLGQLDQQAFMDSPPPFGGARPAAPPSRRRDDTGRHSRCFQSR